MHRADILVGHVLDRIKELPSNHFHCALSSPPYYGPRLYDTEAQLFDGDPKCKHKWSGCGKRHRGGKYGETGERKNRDHSARNATADVDTGDVCLKCNAWRGHLGQEPTLDMYVDHNVTILREVKRILRPGGICWLNLGDVFFGDSPPRRSSEEVFDSNWKTGSPRRSASRQGSLKAKDLCLAPARVALALQAGFSRCTTCHLELRSDLWPVWSGVKVCIDCLKANRDHKVKESELGWWVRMDCVWAKINSLPESVEDRPVKAHEYVFMSTKHRKYFYDYWAVRQDVVRRHSQARQPA